MKNKLRVASAKRLYAVINEQSCDNERLVKEGQTEGSLLLFFSDFSKSVFEGNCRFTLSHPKHMIIA
jgi:hypothetical protein